ncbi:MAG: SpvB/TcaC N-terminal domain-containing protein [bacterium]
MKNHKIKLICLVLSILIANVINLFSLDFFSTVPYFEDDKYLESVISYNETPNTDLYLRSITCSSIEELINVKEIFIKQAVADLIRRSAFYHGNAAYQPYQQKIYVPSCLTHTSTYMGLGQYSGKNDPKAYKEYPWLNEFTTCDTTKWDLLQLTLQLVDGEVIILNSMRIPNICMNVPLTCTPSNNLLNTFTTMTPDWSINPPYSTTTPFGMPANSILVKPNILQTYTEGTKTINYMNMYEEYALPNDLTWRAVVRKPQIREDSDSLTEIDHKGLFKQIIEKTLVDIIDRPAVENGSHTVVLEFPDLDIGDKDIEYGDPTVGCFLTVHIKKDDDGIFLDSADYTDLKPPNLPEIGDDDKDIKIGSYLTMKAMTFLPIDFEYEGNRDSFAIGTIQGNHSVSSNGAFTYSIPIDIAPGTNGVQPSVGISYNSQAGEGIAGYGWGISAGQSSISRSPKFLNIDGANVEIKYNNTDKIVFNGTTLVMKDPSDTIHPYGTINSVYVPEVGGDFASVKLMGGSLNSDDSWFLVEMLDGTLVEYGNESHSPHCKRWTKGFPISWEISRVIDPNGNYYNYKYINQNNSLLLYEIEYTGHLDKDSFYHYIDSTPPYAQIKFNYQSRTDIAPEYSYGKEVQKNEILKNIQLLVNDEVYKQFNFFYENQNNIYLKKIELVGQNGMQYNATVFNYNNSSYSQDLQVTDIPVDSIDLQYRTISPDVDRKTIFGDFNGDGFLDRVFIDIAKIDSNNGNYQNTKWYLQLGKKFNGTEIEYEPTVDCNNIDLTGCSVYPDNVAGSDNFIDTDNIMISDIDNDGFDDIIIHRMVKDENLFDLKSELWQIKYDTITGKLKKQSSQLVSNIKYSDNARYDINYFQNQYLLMGDYDGDGFSEILMSSLIYDGNIEQNRTFLYFFDIVNRNGEIQNLDYSNALADSCYFIDQYGGTNILLNNPFNIGTKNGKNAILLTDLEQDVPAQRFVINSSTHTLEKIPVDNNLPDDILSNLTKENFGDFNGDGKEDIYKSYTKTNTITGIVKKDSKIYYWDGDKFNEVALESLDTNSTIFDRTIDSADYHCNSYSYVADLNGDNKDDILEYNIYTRITANQDTVYDYEYVICMPKAGGKAKFYSKRINKSDLEYYDLYKMGTPVLDANNHYALPNGFNNIGQYLYNKNSFHSVSLSNKFDLANQGRAGLYVNGKFLSFFDAKDNNKMKELYDGFGNKLAISYKQIVNDEVYERKTHNYVKDYFHNDMPQLRYINFGIDVVDSVKSIQATDSTMINTITYQYSGAVLDRINKGFLGFEYFQSNMETVVNNEQILVNPVNTEINLNNESINGIYSVKNSTDSTSAFYILLTKKNRTNRPATINNNIGSETIYEYSFQTLMNNRFFLFLHTTDEINYNLQTRKTLTQDYDNNHQLTTQTMTLRNLDSYNIISSENVDYTYTNATYGFGNISLLSQQVVEKWHHDDPSTTPYTRQTDYEYFDSTGNYQLRYIYYDRNIESLAVRNSFAYDEFGNVVAMLQEDVSDAIHTLPLYRSECEYDSQGRFVTETMDKTGYKSYTNINDLGQVLSTQDIQGNHTSYYYNSMGKLWQTVYPNGARSEVTLEWCTPENDPAIKTGVYPLYKVHNKNVIVLGGNTTDSYSYFDSWSRGVISESSYMDSYNGTTQTDSLRASALRYYSNGQVSMKFDTYNPNVKSLDGSLPVNRTFLTYDELGRLKQTNTLFGGEEFYTGFGRNVRTDTTIYDGAGGASNKLKTVRTVDAAGNFVSKKDAMGNIVTAKYLHSGQIDSTNGVKFEYDVIGRKTKMKDPDAGTIHYSYNVYGDLIQEVHDNISKKDISYDDYGRVDSVAFFRDSSGVYIQDAYTLYEYNELINNEPSNGLGQVKKITYQQVRLTQIVKYEYDSKGLLILKTDTLQQNLQGNEFDTLVFKTQYEYDYADRLKIKTLPSISDTNGAGIKLLYIYNKYNEIIEIHKISAGDTTRVWMIKDKDIYGKPREIELGENLGLKTAFTYDSQQRLATKNTTWNNFTREKWELAWETYTGNMLSREYYPDNTANGFKENYTYDNLDRLVNSKDSVSTNLNLDDIVLDSIAPNLNNIFSKQNLGNYKYKYIFDSTQTIYTDKHASDNAVKQIETSSTDINHYGQKLTYTSFNSVKTIQETIVTDQSPSGNITAVFKKEFYYGSDGQRVLMVSKRNDTIVAKKYYIGEYEYTDSVEVDKKKEVTFISAPTGLVSAQVKIGNVSNYYYILTDHLGSITQLLHSNGDPVTNARFTYDAWGRLRDLTNTANPYLPNTDQTIAFHILDRGYCGHEHLLDHGIINMNGRIYDPTVGQFMQADNYIQTPEDYIGYNRYAYCRHNPFKYVDPSGEMLTMEMDNSSSYVSEGQAILSKIQAQANAMCAAYFNWIEGEDDGTSFFGTNSSGGGTATTSGTNTGNISQQGGTSSNNSKGKNASEVLLSPIDPDKVEAGEWVEGKDGKMYVKGKDGMFYSDLPWMETAKGELGTTESDPGSNQKVNKYFGPLTTGNLGQSDWNDNSAWCAAFGNWVYTQNDMPSTNNALASSFKGFGMELDEPIYGAGFVLRTKWGLHTGFIAGMTPNNQLVSLGGNQGDPGMVKYSPFSYGCFLYFYWPINNNFPPGSYLPIFMKFNNVKQERTK